MRRVDRWSCYCTLLLVAAGSAGCRADRAPAPATRGPAPRRIISLAPNAAEIIAALGASDRLVAVSDFCVYPPELNALPRVGGLFNPDLEAIVTLRPDLIVLRGRSASLERLCADRGIRVFLDPTESFDDIYVAIRELGDLLDRRQEAAALEGEMRRRLVAVAGAVAGRVRPRVFVTVARRPDSLAGILTASRGTFVHEIITRAGGDNVFSGTDIDYPQVSPEAILAAQPDVIVEAMPEAEPSAELERSVRDLWRRLGSLPASQTGRVFILTEDNALIPSPRVVEVIERLARRLHPGVEFSGGKPTDRAATPLVKDDRGPERD
jgi:iron complex transport system substrate-binding protein